MAVEKAAVSVTEMARMVGLSRARFYQLQKAGIFPLPERRPETGRPYYTEELQRACLEVRRRNCGIDGTPILFYARRVPVSKPRKAKARTARNAGQYDDLTDGLKSLGLSSVTDGQVGAAVQELFPQGTASVEDAEVIRAVFLHLRRQNA
jgi:hypothetical protein